MAVREIRILRLARGIACLGKKTGSRAIYCSFLFSLVIHTLFLLYAGQPTSRQCLDRRIKVDLVPLKAPSPSPQTPIEDTSQPKDIPRPYYVRSKGIPHQSTQSSQAKRVRIPTECQNLKPVFSPPQTVPLEKPLADQETTDKADHADKADKADKAQERAAEGIFIPSSDSLGPHVANVAAQVADAAAQVKEILLSNNLPMKIKAGSDHLDPALDYQSDQELIRRYQKAIYLRIKHHQKFPSQARKKGWEGSVSVKFIVHRDGRVEEVKVTRSSAIALFDEAAIHAVKDGNPFPPFPEGIRESSLLFEVPLGFELRDKSD